MADARARRSPPGRDLAPLTRDCGSGALSRPTPAADSPGASLCSLPRTALDHAPGAPASSDFALGSRYAPGGSTAEKWGPVRRLNSWIATVLARPFAGRTSDPMSGFFALRRETYERAQRLK